MPAAVAAMWAARAHHWQLLKTVVRAWWAHATKARAEREWKVLAKVGAIAAGRTCGESAPSGPPLEAADPTPTDATAWLTAHNLLPEADLPDLECLRRYLAFSKCSFGERVALTAKKRFMRLLLPWEHRLAAI